MTAYFGVNVPGALLALGDGHARQGEGEVCGVGGRVRRCAPSSSSTWSRAVPTPWPRLETDDFLMTTGSARPLEDAYRISQHDLVTLDG